MENVISDIILMKDGVYMVQTNNYVFEMCVIHYGSTYTIKYGDATNREEGPCIEITYDTKREHIARLDSVAYYERCSANKTLEKRHGTHEMLQTVLKILSTNFPKIKRILFKDVSAFDCNGRKVWLSYYGLLVYGITWYEKHFAAKPLEPHIRDAVVTFKTLLLQKPKRGVFSFAKNIKNFETWNEYFRSIKDCTYFLENMDSIERVSGVKLVYSDWYISVRKIADYKVDILSVKSIKKKYGGGSIGLVVSDEPI